MEDCLALGCNSCGQRLDGSTYRTICQHIFCIDCAQRAFTQTSSCPACGTRLAEGEIFELIVGVGGGPLEEALYSFALQDVAWAAVIDKMQRIQISTGGVMAFVTTQLLQESLRLADHSTRLRADYDQQKSEYNKASAVAKSQVARLEQRVRELEHMVTTRANEMNDLKEAYVEKSKRCSAWEKAYQQVTGQARSEGSPERGRQVLDKPHASNPLLLLMHTHPTSHLNS